MPNRKLILATSDLALLLEEPVRSTERRTQPYENEVRADEDRQQPLERSTCVHESVLLLEPNCRKIHCVEIRRDTLAGAPSGFVARYLRIGSMNWSYVGTGMS